MAIACRDDDRLAAAGRGDRRCRGRSDAGYATLAGRLANQDALDEHVAAWTAEQRQVRGAAAAARRRRAVLGGADAAANGSTHDPDTEGLWPTVTHTAMGEVRVDGLPARFSKTPWRMTRGAPCLGEHNEAVFGRLLGLSPDEVAELAAEGVDMSVAGRASE